MDYQVIARKWRPQRFDEVVGQEHITSTLKYAVLHNRLAPVYLFTGIRGTGKTTLARILVKALNCLDIQPDGEPCNKCENCLEIGNGKCPDVVEIDGASNNSVDNVRNIKENVSYFPIKSKFKVYIIDEVHMLSKSAFNALLKTLEEPPAHTVFILATTDPQKIPTTVLSRCQRYDLKRLSLDDAVGQMAKILDFEHLTYDMESLYTIAREGEGSMRDCQTILEQLVTFGGGKITEEEVSLILGTSDKRQLRGIIEAVVSHDTRRAVSLVAEIYKHGKSIEKAAKDLLYLIGQVLLFSELKSHDFSNAPKEEKEWVEKVSALASTSDWLRLFRFWNGEYESIKTSDFSLMIFEVAVITAASFPATSDFKTFAKSVASGLLSISAEEPVLEKKISESEPIIPINSSCYVGNNAAEVLQNSQTDRENFHSEEQISPSKVEGVSSDEIQDVRSIETDDSASTSDKKGALPPQSGGISAFPSLMPEERPDWRSFIETFRESDPFFYGILINIPYSETETAISLEADSILSFARENLAELKGEFCRYFRGRKELEIKSEKGGNLSLYSQEQTQLLEHIEKRKNDVKQSRALKEAAELGLVLKTIVVE